MEIHHRFYEKPGNGAASLMVPSLCGPSGTVVSGIPETTGNPGAASTSSGAFIPLGSVATNTNDLTGYGGGIPDDCSSSALSSSRTGGPPSLSLGLAAADLNTIHQQQQQQQRATTLSQNSGNNVCVVVGGAVAKASVATTAQSERSNGNGNNNSSTISTNEPNFSQRISKFEAEICSSCSEFILDRTLLSVNSRFWHVSCLRCSQCSMLLEQYPSCFVKDDTFFCKQCYSRQFGTKCSSCRRLIQATDWVRRARNFVYHLACFSCDQCKRQLSTGEEFALQDCRLLCKQHYLELVEGDSGQQKAKAKRVRTTFAEEQLAVLQTHFQIDSNPDGADLERIATMTGLSKRVTQVWFQNSRARQKKYQGSKKNRLNHSNNSGRSSTDPCSSPKSPSVDSPDGMIFPTSVLTSVEDAMVAPEQQRPVLPTSL